MLAVLNHEGGVESLLVCLVVVAVVSAFVFLACHLVGRPDIGRLGAAVVAVLGAVLCLI